jgi:predicted DCC family thiol-disulfide oxidoreductase YuxK
MMKLTVLYDAGCGFCVRCRWWLAMQPAFFELECLPAGSPEARRRFPGLESLAAPDELVVVDDEGGIYEGAHAWLMCLYALQEYRELSLQLSSPLLLPMARKVFEWVSSRRKKISEWLEKPPGDEGPAPEPGES